MAGTPVTLYVYDLTKGLAKSMSLPLIGKQLDGIWHTSIVIFDREYFYGGGGVESCQPGGTILGRPDQIHHLGNTEVTYSLFLDYLGGLGAEDYSGDKYNLFDHNCNSFSNEVAEFLTSKHIPSFIINLPQEILNTPIGAILKPIMDSMSANPMGKPTVQGHRPAYDPVIPISQQQLIDSNTATNGSIDANEPSTSAANQDAAVAGVGKDSNKDGGAGKEKSASVNNDESVNKEDENDAAASGSSTNGERTLSGAKTSPASLKKSFIDEELTEEKYQETMRRLRMPISATLKLFKEANPEACVDAVKASVPEGLLTPEELALLDSLKVSLIIIPDDCYDDPPPPVHPQCFLVIGKLLSLPVGELSPDVLHPLVDCLQLAFLKQDVITLMQENDDHMIMNFVSMCECQTLEVQIAVLRMLCNICSCWKGYHWLTSIIEWPSHTGEQITNGRVVSSLACNCLLTGFDAIVQPAAILAYNISKYTISEDFAIDFACALYQCLQSGELSEDTVYHCLSAVYNMMKKYSEVAALANIMGLDLQRFGTISDKVSKVCQDIDIVMKDK
ncbi:uncharacterized protein [Amphiura filiformis]|uniref:uncharacterized protein isoform X2 n=1 Tax=Amphiura filiformis TaxID=82378 RepID=UPI003B21AC92